MLFSFFTIYLCKYSHRTNNYICKQFISYNNQEIIDYIYNNNKEIIKVFRYLPAFLHNLILKLFVKKKFNKLIIL